MSENVLFQQLTAMNLKQLADKYETKDFIVGDPSWFMHQVTGDTNRELMAFIASALSYGSRKQFLPKIQYILDASHGDIVGWLTSGQFSHDIPATDDCYYRLYTCRMMHDFLTALAQMVTEYGSIKAWLTANMQTKDCLEAISLITNWFATHGSRGIIPKPITCSSPRGSWKGASCKRVCMFLRWMVRADSPVDLGLWSDIIDRRTLIIPMDTHVVQEANRMGLTSSKATSMSAAIRLTKALSLHFPDDPVRADFALFGLGIDN